MYIIEAIDCHTNTLGHQSVEKYTCNDCKDVVDILIGIVDVSKGALNAFDSKIWEILMNMKFGDIYGPVYWNSHSITIECVFEADEEADILAPCPFCGHEPEMSHMYYGYASGMDDKAMVRWQPHCVNCGCEVYPETTMYELNVKTGKMDIVGEDGRLKAIRKWNRSARRF